MLDQSAGGRTANIFNVQLQSMKVLQPNQKLSLQEARTLEKKKNCNKFKSLDTFSPLANLFNVLLSPDDGALPNPLLISLGTLLSRLGMNVSVLTDTRATLSVPNPTA